MNGHGGNIYGFNRPGLIDFSSNINPFGPPPAALLAANEALSRINAYPDASQYEIRRAFSEWLGVANESLVFGNGASDLIPALISALAPSRVMVTHPTFSEYESRAGILGLPVIGIPSDASRGFAFDVPGIEKNLRGGDMLFICQPNNPTGITWTAEEIASLAAACCEIGAYLVSDECFINLAYPRPPSCVPLTGLKNVAVLRAITKDFSAPGLRIGFAICHPDIASRIRANLQTWPLNCVGEAFAAACARNPEPFLGDSAREIARLRESLSLGLSSLGFAPNAGRANFLLVRSDMENAARIHDRVLEKSALIRKCDNFPVLDDRYFRVAVKREQENAALLSALRE